MSRFKWIGLMAALGVGLAPALAAETVVINEDFESYTVDQTLHGQGAWSVILEENGASVVVVTDPDDPGNQVIRVQNYDGVHGSGTTGMVRFRIPAVVDGPAIIKFSYDLEYADNRTDFGSGSLIFRLYDTNESGGLTWPLVAAQCYDGGNNILAAQYTTCVTPNASTWVWSWDEHTGPAIAVGSPRINLAWVIYLSGQADGKSQLIKKVVTYDDDTVVEIPTRNSYAMTYGVPGQLALACKLADFRLAGDGDKETTLYMDNIRIAYEPMSGPTADAGEYPGLQPCTYDGAPVDTDASASAGGTNPLDRYQWVLGPTARSVLADGDSPLQTIWLPCNATTDAFLNVYDSRGIYDTDVASVQTGGPDPIAVDDVQVPWGIIYGDIQGTAASATTPVLVNEDQGFAVLNQTTSFSTGPDYVSGFCFDVRGNLYHVSWNGYLQSYGPDLSFRWTGHEFGTDLRIFDFIPASNPIVVGKRYVYVAGYESVGLGWGVVYAFEKTNGQLAWMAEPFDLLPPAGTPPFKLTLYEDKLYLVSSYVALGETYVCQINATTGAIEGTSLIPVDYCVDCDANPGNVAFIPDAFGPDQHGLFWNQASGGWSAANDFLADMVGVRLNPAAGTAVSAWGAGSGVDGPYLWRSHVMGNPTSGVLYTPSYNDWGTSLYAWDAGAANGAQLLGSVPRTIGGNHGHQDASAVEWFTGDVRVHSTTDAGVVYTYIDDLGDGTSFTAEQRGFDSGGALLGPTVAVVYDAANDRAVMYANVHNARPARVVAMDLYGPTTVFDDGPAYVDDIEILVGNSPDPNTWTSLYTYDFESLTLGPINGQESWIGFGPEYDPDNVTPPTIVDLSAAAPPLQRAGKVVVQDPNGKDGSTWFEGWPFPQTIDPFYSESPAFGYDYVILRFWSYRTDLTDTLRYYVNYDGQSGYYAAAWDTNGKWHAYEYNGPTAQQTAGVWQKVERVFFVDQAGGGFNANARIYVDGNEDDPLAAPFVMTFPVFMDYFDFTMDATAITSAGVNPYIAEWVDPDDYDVIRMGPTPGPDGTLYIQQGNRLTRLGAAAGPSFICADTNCDGAVDTADIDNFVYVVVNGTAAPGCPSSLLAADTNEDGAVDTADIDSFVAAVVAGGCQ
jgi:hypothetical protein